jgi:hypothetical protein
MIMTRHIYNNEELSLVPGGGGNHLRATLLRVN